MNIIKFSEVDSDKVLFYKKYKELIKMGTNISRFLDIEEIDISICTDDVSYNNFIFVINSDVDVENIKKRIIGGQIDRFKQKFPESNINIYKTGDLYVKERWSKIVIDFNELTSKEQREILNLFEFKKQEHQNQILDLTNEMQELTKYESLVGKFYKCQDFDGNFIYYRVDSYDTENFKEVYLQLNPHNVWNESDQNYIHFIEYKKGTDLKNFGLLHKDMIEITETEFYEVYDKMLNTFKELDIRK